MKSKLVSILSIILSLLVLTSCVRETNVGNKTIKDANKLKNEVNIKIDNLEIDNLEIE